MTSTQAESTHGQHPGDVGRGHRAAQAIAHRDAIARIVVAEGERHAPRSGHLAQLARRVVAEPVGTHRAAGRIQSALGVLNRLFDTLRPNTFEDDENCFCIFLPSSFKTFWMGVSDYDGNLILF